MDKFFYSIGNTIIVQDKNFILQNNIQFSKNKKNIKYLFYKKNILTLHYY